jgi:hypothetical protein
MHKKPTITRRVRAEGATLAEVRKTPPIVVNFVFDSGPQGDTLNLVAVDEDGYVVGHQPYADGGARAIRDVLDTWLRRLEPGAPAAITTRLAALADATPGLAVVNGPLAQMGDKGDN